MGCCASCLGGSSAAEASPEAQGVASTPVFADPKIFESYYQNLPPLPPPWTYYPSYPSPYPLVNPVIPIPAPTPVDNNNISNSLYTVAAAPTVFGVPTGAVFYPHLTSTQPFYPQINPAPVPLSPSAQRRGRSPQRSSRQSPQRQTSSSSSTSNVSTSTQPERSSRPSSSHSPPPTSSLALVPLPKPEASSAPAPAMPKPKPKPRPKSAPPISLFPRNKWFGTGGNSTTRAVAAPFPISPPRPSEPMLTQPSLAYTTAFSSPSPPRTTLTTIIGNAFVPNSSVLSPARSPPAAPPIASMLRDGTRLSPSAPMSPSQRSPYLNRSRTCPPAATASPRTEASLLQQLAVPASPFAPLFPQFDNQFQLPMGNINMTGSPNRPVPPSAFAILSPGRPSAPPAPAPVLLAAQTAVVNPAPTSNTVVMAPMARPPMYPKPQPRQFGIPQQPARRQHSAPPFSRPAAPQITNPQAVNALNLFAPAVGPSFTPQPQLAPLQISFTSTASGSAPMVVQSRPPDYGIGGIRPSATTAAPTTNLSGSLLNISASSWGSSSTASRLHSSNNRSRTANAAVPDVTLRAEQPSSNFLSADRLPDVSAIARLADQSTEGSILPSPVKVMMGGPDGPPPPKLSPSKAAKSSAALLGNVSNSKMQVNRSTGNNESNWLSQPVSFASTLQTSFDLDPHRFFSGSSSQSQPQQQLRQLQQLLPTSTSTDTVGSSQPGGNLARGSSWKPQSRSTQRRHTIGSRSSSDLAQILTALHPTDPEACCMCMDARKDVLFVPCRHVCCCRACGQNVRFCPVCRTTVEKLESVFVS